MEISRTGTEAQLTHNSRNFGISSFGASQAGVIMADSASGLDKLATLTPKGVDFLENGTGSAPDINPAGEITYVVPPLGKDDPYFKVEVRKSFSSRARAVFTRRTSIGVSAWGPGGALAILVGSHYPGTAGPTPQLVVLSRDGKARTVKTSLGKQLGNVIWGSKARCLAAIGWNGASTIVYPDGHVTHMPHGWIPQAWNSSGTELLVWGPGTPGYLALWSPKHPTTIVRIGEPSVHTQIGQFVWLSTRAKL